MTLVSFIQLMQRLIRDHKKRIFSLREIAALGAVSRPSAGMTLLRAEKKGLVFRVANLWINRMDPPDISEIAFALSSPSYLSFESALYHHNILSQSPRGALTVATAGRPREVQTPFGLIRFTHLNPSLFFGYDSNRIAHPEKAWLDLIYIRGRKGRKEILTEEVYLKQLDRRRLGVFEKKFPRWVAEMRQSILV